MKTLFISVLCLLFSLGTSAQWKPVGDRIKTQWAEQINPDNVLPEYFEVANAELTAANMEVDACTRKLKILQASMV